jgi:hypothetical protein
VTCRLYTYVTFVALLLSAKTFSGAWITPENVTYDVQQFRVDIGMIVRTVFASVAMPSDMVSALGLELAQIQQKTTSASRHAGKLRPLALRRCHPLSLHVQENTFTIIKNKVRQRDRNGSILGLSMCGTRFRLHACVLAYLLVADSPYLGSLVIGRKISR